MRTQLALVIVVLSACGPKKEDIPENPPPVQESAEPRPAPPPVKKAPTLAEMGTCHLQASGAVKVDQTTPGGRPATNVSYWLSEAEQKNMMGVDGFVVNCIGPEMKFQIVPGGGKKDGMPFKPKRYDFDKGKGDANVMVAFGKQTLTQATGSIDITAFDSHHIVGAVDLAGKLAPGGGDVKLTGSFDLTCPGFSACEK